jgi:hypothetical protein
MSLPIKLPISARPTITANIFTATWNNPTLNRYDFTNVAGNQNQIVLTMTGSSIYVIERVCFSMSIPEGVFQESIDSAINVPWLIFKTQKTNAMIFDRPQPFINYLDNLEMLLFIPGNQSQDTIIVSFEAVLNQVAATVGINTIKAFLQLNIYEVQNTDWIRRFYHNWENTIGDLGLRGKDLEKTLRINEGTFS